MDEFVQSLIAGAPNLAVALLMLFWQQQRINRLEEHLLALNQYLLERDDDGKEETD